MGFFDILLRPVAPRKKEPPPPPSNWHDADSVGPTVSGEYILRRSDGTHHVGYYETAGNYWRVHGFIVDSRTSSWAEIPV